MFIGRHKVFTLLYKKTAICEPFKYNKYEEGVKYYEQKMGVLI